VSTKGSSGGTGVSKWSHSAIPIVVTTILVCLGLANVAALATWSEVEDGVLWRRRIRRRPMSD
jgi:hypothetical protein